MGYRPKAAIGWLGGFGDVATDVNGLNRRAQFINDYLHRNVVYRRGGWPTAGAANEFPAISSDAHSDATWWSQAVELYGPAAIANAKVALTGASLTNRPVAFRIFYTGSDWSQKTVLALGAPLAPIFFLKLSYNMEVPSGTRNTLANCLLNSPKYGALVVIPYLIGSRNDVRLLERNHSVGEMLLVTCQAANLTPVNIGIYGDPTLRLIPTGPPSNTRPVAISQTRTVGEDLQRTVVLTGSDTEGSPLTFAISRAPGHGTLTGTPPNVVYHPALHYNGSDFFEFTVSDGQLTSLPATVNMTVTVANDVPIANDQTRSLIENTSRALILTGSDVEGAPLTFAITRQPVSGTLSGSPPNLTYTPNREFVGDDSFQFIVRDGAANSRPATVFLTVVTPGGPPAPEPDSIIVISQGGSSTQLADGAYSVLANDDQRNGDSLDAQMAQPPQHGTLELHPDGTFKYVHNGGLDTEDLFTYFVRDSSGARGEATVVISIFRVLGFQQSTNDLRFTFSTQAGVDYEVDANSTSPAPGAPWQSLTGRFPGVTGVMQMVDPDHSPKYYRVICHSGSGDLLSDPIGHGDLHLKTGWNAINNPFHPFPIFVGTVTAVTEDTLTVAGPGWTPQEFEPQDGFPQFVVMVPWAVPNSRAQPGDWWPILGNGGNTLQVDTRGQHLNSGLAVGDAIELRRLNSFSQLFGTGDEAGSVTPDIPHDGSLALVFNDFESHLAVSFRSTAPDVVSCFYTLNGTDYGPLDGSTISVLPGCGVYYHRVAEPVTRPIFGRVQTFPLTHYAVNTVRQVGSPFPVPAPVATSGLLEAGWVSQTAAGSLDRDEIQVINPGGTNLSIIHRAIPGTPTGWYVNGVLDNTVAFEPGRSQWLRLVARPSPFIWNEHVPWEP